MQRPQLGLEADLASVRMRQRLPKVQPLLKGLQDDILVPGESQQVFDLANALVGMDASIQDDLADQRGRAGATP